MLKNFNFRFDPQLAVPKYRQFAEALADYLSASGAAPGSKLPNDRELSRRYGIAVVTMSRALGVLAEKGLLERRIGAGTFVAVREQEFTRRVALVCHDNITSDQGFVSTLWDELHRQAPDYQIELLTLQKEPKDYLRAVSAYNLDGLIVLSAKPAFIPEFKDLVRRGLNLVQVGMFHRDCPAISFGTDHRQAAHEAVEYLHAMGHRKIGFITQSFATGPHISSDERIRGYRMAMYRKNLPVNPDWLLEAGNRTKLLADSIYALHDQGEMPTAFMVDSIRLSPLLYHIMKTLDLDIPGDISLIGFDNVPLCDTLSPGLTTYGHDTGELVGKVFAHLCRRNSHDGKPLQAVLTDRGSCTAPQKR